MLKYLLPAIIFVQVLAEKFCVPVTHTLRAKHKSCFLRPDSGPCRADIVQWYFDAKQQRCYRFFWGGCQGNGNRFEHASDCYKYCHFDLPTARSSIPYYCDLPFDYGTCFGHFDRWGFDNMYKTCKRHVYSGCGGNQNHFETIEGCLNTCVRPPDNSMDRVRMTTCFPVDPNLGIVDEATTKKRRRKTRKTTEEPSTTYQLMEMNKLNITTKKQKKGWLVPEFKSRENVGKKYRQLQVNKVE